MRQVENRPAVKAEIVFESKKNTKNNTSEEDPFIASAASTAKYSYPLKLLVPDHASSSSCSWLYMITYGGGLVEGDDISLSIKVQDNCSVMLTSQGFNKVYHCKEGKESKQRLDCWVEENALLAVIPDPLVCFKEAIYKQTQSFHMEPSSNLILLEWITAGRVALGEHWQFTRCYTKNSVQYGNKVVVRDSMNLCDRPDLPLCEAMRGYKIMGLLLIMGPQLVDIVSKIVEEVGQPHSYGEEYDASKIVSVSKIQHQIEDSVIKGCVVRIAAVSTEPAIKEIEKLLSPAFSILGGNPFENKY